MKDNLNNSEDFLKSVLQKGTGFTIPENYFDKIENSIIEKIVPNKEVKIISLKRILLKYIPFAAAASIALFLSLNYLNLGNIKEVSFETLAQSDIENWVIENSNELSDQDFVALLHSGIVNENDFALTDIKNDDIEEYIIYSDDTSLLNENY